MSHTVTFLVGLLFGSWIAKAFAIPPVANWYPPPKTGPPPVPPPPPPKRFGGASQRGTAAAYTAILATKRNSRKGE